jgi:hypothetical protein
MDAPGPDHKPREWGADCADVGLHHLSGFQAKAKDGSQARNEAAAPQEIAVDSVD